MYAIIIITIKANDKKYSIKDTSFRRGVGNNRRHLSLATVKIITQRLSKVNCRKKQINFRPDFFIFYPKTFHRLYKHRRRPL